MSAATPLIVGPKSQEALIAFSKECYNVLNQQWNVRSQMLSIDKAYQREVDYTEEQAKAKRANRAGDPTKFQNVVVPVVMPQVEAAVTYQASVFLTGVPIFDWVAPPAQQSAADMFSAITEENAIRGGWTQQLMIWFKDAFKYNLAFMETTYGRIVTNAVETNLALGAGRRGEVKQVIWEGNILKRWDPYNTFWDTRYVPSEVYKNGEFIGRTEIMSRVHLKKFLSELPDKMVSNVRLAFESGVSGALLTNADSRSYYIPAVNPNALLTTSNVKTTNWMAWAGLMKRPLGEIQYRDLYEVTTLYARIIPQDFGIRVPSSNTPQVWKFIIVNHSTIVYAERQTNAHNYLPVLIGQPYEDGLGYQTKSLADNSRSFQEVGSALINSAMAARRRAISDRGIYNPLLVSAAHINNDSPTAKIPMRPAGYGKNPAEAYAAIPFRDEQSGTAFQELGQIIGLSNTLNGTNQAKQGQFVKGNRTQREYESVMANANGRDQVTSIVLEAQVFTPMKEIIKLNTLQYQQGTSIYSPKQEKLVKIDPIALRRAAVTFKISDGLAPTDKIINGDDFAIALQTMGTSPAIGAGYNIAPAFSYIMKTRNVDLTAFEKSPGQIAYEQAVSAWQQAAIEIGKAGGKDFPPQPVPAQYGYNPNAPLPGAGNPEATNNAPGVPVQQQALPQPGAIQ